MSSAVGTSSSEWNDFRHFGKQIKALSGVVTAVGTVLPISGAYWTAWVPPWPQGSYFIASGLSLLTVLLLFLVYRQSTVAELPSRGRAILLYSAGLGVLTLYIILLRNLTVTVGDDIHVTGFGLTDEAREAISKRLVSNDTKDLLDYYGHQSEDRIWRDRSAAYLALFLSFCAGSVLVVAGFSLIVVHNFVQEKVLAAQAQPATLTTARTV